MFPDALTENPLTTTTDTPLQKKETLYYHKILREPDKDHFIEAMHIKANDQYENGNFSIILRKHLPEGAKVHRCVWHLKWKRDIKKRNKNIDIFIVGLGCRVAERGAAGDFAPGPRLLGGSKMGPEGAQRPKKEKGKRGGR